MSHLGSGTTYFLFHKKMWGPQGEWCHMLPPGTAGWPEHQASNVVRLAQKAWGGHQVNCAEF